MMRTISRVECESDLPTLHFLAQSSSFSGRNGGLEDYIEVCFENVGKLLVDFQERVVAL